MLASPLRNFPIVESTNAVDLINCARRLYRGSISPLGPLPSGDHILRGLAGTDFSIGYIASDLQVRINSEMSANSYFVNFGVVGAMRARREDEDANLSEAEATVFNPGDAQELRPTMRGSGLLGLRLDASVVQDELAGLIGHSVEAPTRFDFQLDLARPKGRAVGMLVGSLVEQLDSCDPLFYIPAVQRTMVRPIVTALLLAQRHTFSDELDAEPSAAKPRTLRKALAYIDAQLAERFTLGDLARASGCSARTIGMLFQHEFGVTPMAYVRNARLDCVRGELRSSDDTVGVVAYRWGITHLGRFAADYRDRFHELPSETITHR